MRSKYSLIIICLFCFYLVACTSPMLPEIVDLPETGITKINPTLKLTPTRKFDFTPTATWTATPEITTTPTSTSTQQLPVSNNTPVPHHSEAINASNIDQVKLLASWGENFISSAKYFQEYASVIVKTYDGFEVMDPETYEIRATIKLDEYEIQNAHVIDYAMVEKMKLVMLTIHYSPNEFTIDFMDLERGEIISSDKILHEKNIVNGTLSSNGNQMAIIDEEGFIFIVSLNSLSNIQEIGRVSSGYKSFTTICFQFSPDTKFLVFLEIIDEATNITHLWDVVEMVYIGPFYYEANVMGFMPNETTVVLASDLLGQVKFVDILTREEIRVHSPGKNAYKIILIPSSGEFLLSFSESNEIFVWDIKTGSLLSRINAIGFDESNYEELLMQMLYPQMSAYIHEQENYLTIVGMDHSFIKMEITEGKVVEEKDGNAHYYVGPVFVNHDAWIVFADEKGLIQFWDITTNKLINEIKHENRISWMVYAAEKNWLFLGDGMEERYIDLNSFEIFSFSTNRLYNAKISPDQKLLVGSFRGIIHVVDVDSRTLLSKFTSQETGNFIFSPDSKFIVGSISSEYEHGLAVWDVERRYQVIKIPSMNWGPGFAFSEDGKYLFISDSTRSSGTWYEIWDTENWTVVERISTDFDVNFVLNGKYVKNNDQLFSLEDLSNPLVTLPLGYQPVLSDEAFFIATSEGGKIFLWGIN